MNFPSSSHAVVHIKTLDTEKLTMTLPINNYSYLYHPQDKVAAKAYYDFSAGCHVLLRKSKDTERVRYCYPTILEKTTWMMNVSAINTSFKSTSLLYIVPSSS